MIWNKKQKEVTPEEALAAAREELSPYWFGSDPMLIGLDQGNGDYRAFPLYREFVKQLWLIIIVDSTSFWGSSILELTREWETRYRVLSLNILIIYAVRYQFQKNPTAAQKWIEEATTTCVRCFDVNSHLVDAFHGDSLPKALLFKEGKKLLEFSGQNWIGEVDLHIQKALRMTDPGLPLFPVLKVVGGISYDVQSIDLTKREPKMRGLSLVGKWTYDEDKIWTNDPEAKLSFESPGSEVSILARARDNSDFIPFLMIELNGLPPYDSVRGRSLRVSETSDLIVTLNESKLFHLLTGLAPTERQVMISFRNVKESPVEVYGLRFGERMQAAD